MQNPYNLLFGAEGGTRTLTPLRATVFETAVSAIPPLRQVELYFIISKVYCQNSASRRVVPQHNLWKNQSQAHGSM